MATASVEVSDVKYTNRNGTTTIWWPTGENAWTLLGCEPVRKPDGIHFIDTEPHPNGSVIPEFLREPWGIYRWNPEWRRWEAFNKYHGWWQKCGDNEVRSATNRGAWRVSFASTWCEPIAENEASR